MKQALLIAGGVLLALPVLAVIGFLAFFDADAFRPRLAEAVQRATGREFRIEGPLRLTPALTPTIAADGLVLANSEGGSAPEMLRIAHAELRLALLPLISGRIEVASLRLEGGRLLLERGNWRFTREAPSNGPPAEAPPPSVAPVATPPRPLMLDLRMVTLRDWRVTANGEEFRLPQLRLSGLGHDHPLDLNATLIARGTEALIEGQFGAPMAFNSGPWPFRLAAVLPGMRLTAEGTRSGTALQAALGAEIPRLEALNTLTGQTLPALTGISLRAQAALNDGGPSLSALEGRIAGGEIQGLTLTSARLTTSGLEAAGSFRGEALTLTAEAAPMALIAGTPTPVVVRLAGTQANASLTGTWPGALRLEASAPELERLSPLAGRPLPPLRAATLSANLTPIGREGVSIANLALASSAGDMAGALEARWAPRPVLSGRIGGTRLDLGALAPTTPVPPIAAPISAPITAPGPPPAPAPAPAPALALAPALAPAPAPAVSPLPPPPSGRVIPDSPLDLTALRGFDADLAFTWGEIIQGEIVLRDVAGRFVNQAGLARLDPFTAVLPGGRLDLRLAADATGAVPILQIRGGGQGLAPVFLIGPSAPLTGRTDVDLDLRGQGADWRALAASASGHFGIAVIDGRLAGTAARALSQIPGFAGGVPVTCLALRGDVDRGLVRFRAFYLDGAAGRLGGEGGMSLRDETLNIRMLADLRLAGVRVRAPVPLGGTLAAPRLELSALTGSMLGTPPTEQALPDCQAALRIARGGRDGAQPNSAPAPQSNAPPNLNNLLRGLLGR